MVRITLKTTLTPIQKRHPGPTRRNGNRLSHVLIHPRRCLPIGRDYMQAAHTCPTRAIRNIRRRLLRESADGISVLGC